MSYHSSRAVMPSGISNSKKRKEREPPLRAPPPRPPLSSSAHNKPTTAELTLASANRLLAGYMAHEFLTKGTLFGEKFDPARAGAVPLDGRGAGSSASAEPGRGVVVKQQEQKFKGYADVARILKTDGAHIPGVFNPTELARWIQM